MSANTIGIVARLKIVDKLINATAGLVSPYACSVNKTTRPAVGQAAIKTVVSKATPETVSAWRMNIATIGNSKFRKKIASHKCQSMSWRLIRILPKLLPMTIIDNGVLIELT